MDIGLIIGCARSGTSILGELVAAHPGVQYFFEVHRVWEIGGPGPDDSHRLTAADATPEVVAAIRGWFEGESDGRMIVEKCPRNAVRVPYLRAILPEARIIHVVRDGRDTACSLRPGIGGADWQHLKPANWLRLRELAWAERTARLWSEVVTLAEDELTGSGHLLVRYEDLVGDPPAEAARILEFLGLPPSDEVLRFCDRIQDRVPGSYAARRADRWDTPDHEVRIGRWRTNLTPEEQLAVESLTATARRRLGYEVDPATETADTAGPPRA